MSFMLLEAFLRETHSNSVQEWYNDLKGVLTKIEEMDDPNPEDVDLAYHLNSIIESFELMESNLLERIREKNNTLENIFDRKSNSIFD